MYDTTKEINDMTQKLKDLKDLVDNKDINNSDIPTLIEGLYRRIDDICWGLGYLNPQEISKRWNQLAQEIATEDNIDKKTLEMYLQDVQDVGPELIWFPQNTDYKDHKDIVRKDLKDYITSL